MAKQFRVGVFVETTRIYGRKLSEGIADFARERRNWVVAAGGDLLRTDIASLRGRLDGVLARIPDARTARALAALGVPVVDVYCLRPWNGIASVDVNHAAVGTMAARWFLGRRFRSFAYCGYPGVTFSDERGEAFARVTREAGGVCAVYGAGRGTGEDTSRVAAVGPENYGAPADAAGLRRWLRALPPRTAVLCGNDSRAYQVAHLAQSIGLRVPDDLAVMGVDDDSIMCGLTNPMLSSIDNNARTVGHAAAGLLDRLMSRLRRGRALPRIRVAPRCVVERASTETDPVDPPWLSDALRFIRASLDRGINAQDVIRHVGLSHTKVEQVFRAVLGRTLHAEIGRLRFAEARRLLRETSLGINEVSRRAGFSTAQYFSHEFSRLYRMPPGVWRVRKTQSKLRGL